MLSIFIVAMLLTGCRNSSGSGSVLIDGCFMPEDNGSGYELIFVCPITENPYWEDCVNGMNRAGAELGIHTTVIGPKTAENFAVEIVDYIAKAVEKRPDGILAYASIPEMAPYIEKAAELGIPVITIDADATTDRRLAYVGTDLYSLGYKAGETMLSIAEYDAKIGYICSSFEASNEKTMLKAFSDATFSSGMEIVASESGQNDPATAKKITEKMLAEHPEITAIFCTGGYNVTGAGQYLLENSADITLIGCEDVEENLELLRLGAIDALIAQSPEEMGYIGVYAMKEYLDKGVLSGKTYNTESVLITADNVDTYRLGAFSPDLSLKEVRVGYYSGDTAFLSGSEGERKSGYGYEYLQTVAALAGWKYSYEYGTKEELVEKLRKGEIDIVAGIYKTDKTDGLFLSSDDMGLPEPKRYFGVSNDRRDLLEELEGAMRKLRTEKPTYTATLYSKYYELGGSNYALTEAERTYLSDMGELRFGYLRDNLPVCDEDENGNPTGLAKNLMMHIASFTDIPVRPVAFNTIIELENALKNGDIDISFPAYSDIWFSEENNIKQTDPFLNDRVMIVYSGAYSDDIMDLVAVAETNIGQVNYMARFYPDSQVVYYDSKTAVFDAILNGEAKCTIGCSQVFQHFLFNHSEYDNLHVAYLDASFELGLSVNEKNSYLISILNKTVANMGSAKINSALLSYTGIDKTVTVREFIEDNSMLFIFILIVIVAVIALTFFIFFKQTIRHRRIQEESNAALEEALEAANVASLAKTSFLSTMSHDIRTPMNAILGMATIASEDPQVKEHIPYYLEKITTSGRHLLTLINDILDIAKIESGKLTLSPSIVSLSSSMRSLHMIVEPTALEKDITFTSDYSGIEHDTVLADKVRLEQIFLNLLSNAIKYTPSGGRVAAALAGSYDREDNMVHLTFTVEDNGVGMSKDFMKKMYESFSRVEDSRISNIQGSGLGLAIVKQMVDMMGGEISCDSKENVGTKFTVVLDFEAREPESSAEYTDDCTVSLEGLHVLVAEDNDLNWVVISKYLDLFKITGDRAVDGQDCLDILEASAENAYDMVLMDVQMPRLNGRQATVKIRKSTREDIKNIPVVALTADAFAEDIAACKAAGMNGQVSKPIDLDKLRQELKRVLKAHRGDGAEQPTAAEPEIAGGESLEEYEIFSYDKLYSLFGSDETVVKLLQSFMLTHKDDCEALKNCFDSGDYQSARPILHGLIGVSGNFCLCRLCEASKKLRLEVHAERVECFDEFLRVWEQTAAEITDVCNRLEASVSENK